MSEKKIYSLGKTKQLIDVNGNSVNFEAVVKVTSKNREPFDFLVVDQSTLDNSPSLDYQKAATGECSTTVKVENNVFQNYYLVLKADSPVVCEVEIFKNELPLIQEPPNEKNEKPQLSTPSKFNWKPILFGIGVVLICIGVYLYLKPNGEKRNIKNKEIPVPSMHSSPDAKSDSGSSDNNAVIQRLKNLNLR